MTEVFEGEAEDGTSECAAVGITALKLHRSSPAGIGFRKQVRRCAPHVYVSRVTDDSIFADMELNEGDELISMEVPVGGMTAVEVDRLIRDSEGYVTIVAARRRRREAKTKGGKSKSRSGRMKKSARLLTSFRGGGGSSSCSDWEDVAVTAHKKYRTVEAGLGFRRVSAESDDDDDDDEGDDHHRHHHRVLVGDVAPDSIFAATDLRVDDEVLSVEVGADGRTADELAELVRESEGEVTLFVIPKYPRHVGQERHDPSTGGGKGRHAGLVGSPLKKSLFGRSKMFRSVKPSHRGHETKVGSSIGTGLTEGTES
mmetsp:Transcript_53149/g.159063  ORF Transcript_53149/g.159063 Transcript_53149/m.159063 type:complete len:313 (-) Transcript_53149:202-1140(-)